MDPSQEDNADPLRVLYLDSSFTFGGAINSLVHMIRGFDEGEVEAVVVTGQPKGFVEQRAPGAIVYEMALKLPWVHDRWFRYLKSLRPFRLGVFGRLLTAARVGYWFLFVTLPQAFRYAVIGRRHNVDLVHLNNGLESQPDGLLAARMLRVPCIVHHRAFSKAHWQVKYRDRSVSHHIAISTAIRDRLGSQGISSDRISLIHDAIDLDEFCPRTDGTAIRKEFGISGDDLAVGLFGRIVPWKGTREFVLAFQRVIQRIPKAKAYLVGDVSDGDVAYLEAVQELIEASGLKDRCVLTGYRDDVPAVMMAMDLIVHASIKPEPFGMVLIEGMAMEKPIVATVGGGPDDIVLPDITGLLVPRGDPHGLAEAMSELLTDPERRKRMGRAGRDRVERHFSKERYAAEVLAVYHSVRGNRQPAPEISSIRNPGRPEGSPASLSPGDGVPHRQRREWIRGSSI